MVLTRSKDGEQVRRRQEELNAHTATQEATTDNTPVSATSNIATDPSGTGSGTSRSTATEATTVTGKTTTSASEDTSAASHKDQISQRTLRPADTRSRRSYVSRKKILAELEAKERLAELKLKQAQIQAETELQQLRVQRLQAEADASEEEEEEEEEIEDELASVRISTWLKGTDSNQQQSARREEVKKTKEGYVEATQNQEDRMKTHSPMIDVSTLAAALSHAVRSTREPPKYIQELPLFNGNSADWLAFKVAYEETLKYFTKHENLARIRRSLRGTAKEAVGCLLVSQPDPEVVIEALQRRFGRPEALIHVEMEKMKLLNRVTDNPRDLCIFAGRITNIVGTIEALKKPQYLHNPEMARVITEKLTPILKSKWYDYAAKKKEDTPELKKIATFLNEEADKCGAYALPEVTTDENIRRGQKNRKVERTFATGKRTASEEGCPQCKQDHKLPDCKQFSSLDTNARWEIAKKNNICYRCLRSKHRRLLCKAPPCGRHGCLMRHHKLLHHDKEQVTTSDSVDKEIATPTVEITTAAKPCDRRRAYLKIAPVILKGPNTSIETYALLDEGSTVTLLDASIADVIGADGPVNTMWVQGIGNEMRHDNSKVVSLSIKGKHADEEYEIEAARTVERLNFMPETVYERHLEDCEHLIDIKDQITYERASPKLLIGQDNWNLIVSRELRTGRRNQPVASLTQLGWVLHGCHSSLTATIAFCGRLQQRDEPSMEDLIKNHFKLESLCIEPRRPREDPEQKALQILEETSRRLPDGRFETGLLWKDKDVKIPNNYKEAERRLRSLEKKLDKDEDLKQKYEGRMDNLFQSGYAEEAPDPAPEGKTWYLPHFPVTNPAKPHKPPRLVHDASAKASGVCLNDMLHSGPDLLQSLPGVIMRFRQYAYAVSGDIKEMFMQVKIRPEDRDALRFLWRGKRREGKPEEYRMTSVIFGATSSPCTALFIKNKNASEFAMTYPEAAAAIQKNHYMDDYLQSFITITEAQRVTRAVDFIHKKAGFVLNGWTSNDARTIEEFGPLTEDHSATVNLGGKETEKTLGLLWHVKDDCLGFNTNTMKIPTEVEENRRSPTKREALSIIMALFDPLGLISPITTPAKRIFQDTWRYKIDWDDPLPTELEDKWKKWMTSLSMIKRLKIPRCYDYEPNTALQLHTFVDASEEAYAAAVYWRMERADGTVHIALAAAKSRVTPLKPISMPRLELQAALLGARLAQTVLEEHDYDVSSKTYWSDSRTALVWIKSEPRIYKSFVAHRLAEIEETTKKNEWRWLPSKQNVADDATRDTPDDFNSAHRWFQGPAFLQQPESQWPKEESVVKYDTGEEREKCNTCQQRDSDHLIALPKIEKFSKWLRLIRTTARVLHFIDLCRPDKNVVTATRKRTKKTEAKDPDWRNTKTTPPPTQKKKNIPSDAHHYLEPPASYLIKAEQLWIKASQKESFEAEIDRITKGSTPTNNDRLNNLCVYIDSEGTVRLRGRVTAARDIEEDASNPPILDGKHAYTRLYIAHVHEKLHHGGVEAIVNELRQRLWILKIRPAVRRMVRSCLPCRMKKMKPASPLTGDLPPARLAHHARPFSFTGLDYFGPIEVTVARHHEKRYGALFTCMTSRAIHVEVAHSLSADSAISALRRFMARRGCPKEIWSDNATCFKAAEKELAEAALEALRHETTCHQIKWRFIPPAAPFMGGTWERMVRSVKEALRTTLKEKYPSDETLVTLLAEVENTVNSRPLTHVSVDPMEPEALTPNHILIGPNPHVPVPGHFEQEDITARQQWRRAQALADMFWRRWVKEYIPLLQHRREPTSTGTQPKIGDLVIICDNNLPRNTWPRGRITQLYPGADGEVRVVDVATSSGHILRRPTRKIVVLPTESPHGDGGRMCTTPTTSPES